MSVDVCNRTCDEVESDLVVVIEKHVVTDKIDAAVDLLLQLAELDRKVVQEGSSTNSHRTLEFLAVQRREIVRQFDEVSDQIRCDVRQDATAKGLLDSLSRKKSCHNSAIRDALHLIKDARMGTRADRGLAVAEMAVA